MKLATPPFGFISGMGAAMGLLPHLLALCFFLFRGAPPQIVAPLVAFTVGAKLLGEYLFWTRFKMTMDSESKLKHWQTVVDTSLLSHPNVAIALSMMFIDAMVDATLIYTALKTTLSPVAIFLVFLGCQAISSPIQGMLSDYFSQKKSLSFAIVIAILATVLSLELYSHQGGQSESGSAILQAIGLASLSTNQLMILILCVKGLCGNLTVIARAAIATVIKVKTLEKHIRW